MLTSHVSHEAVEAHAPPRHRYGTVLSQIQVPVKAFVDTVLIQALRSHGMLQSSSTHLVLGATNQLALEERSVHTTTHSAKYPTRCYNDMLRPQHQVLELTITSIEE